MPKKRDYGQFCPVAQTLDVIGDRWTILIVRELLVGPVRYGGLLAALAPIATDVLARRLREMEASGLIVRADSGYDLTDDGEQLTPVLQALARWGTGRLTPPAVAADHSTDFSAARAIQWLILAGRPDDHNVHDIEVVAGDLTVTLASTPGGYRARRGRGAAAEAVVVTDDETLWAVLTSAGRWPAAQASGALTVQGDTALAEHLLAGRLPGQAAELLDV